MIFSNSIYYIGNIYFFLNTFSYFLLSTSIKIFWTNLFVWTTQKNVVRELQNRANSALNIIFNVIRTNRPLHRLMRSLTTSVLFTWRDLYRECCCVEGQGHWWSYTHMRFIIFTCQGEVPFIPFFIVQWYNWDQLVPSISLQL